MQANVDSRVVEKLRKMLALASDERGDEYTASIAAAKAAKLMEDYGISMAEVELAGGRAEGRTEDESESAYGAWYGPLMQAIGQSFMVDVAVAVHVGAKNRSVSFSLIGRVSAVASAKITYEYLRQAVWRLCREADVPSRRHFRHGCAERIIERLTVRHQDRLREQRREAAARDAEYKARHAGQDTSVPALVLADVTRDEREANTDLREGLKPGTTRQLRMEQEAKNAEMDALQQQGVSWSVAWDVVYGRMTLERALANEKFALEMRESQPQEKPKQETDAQRERREARERRDRQKYRERSDREARKRNSPSWSAGRDAGETVGLEQQVSTGKTRRIS